jgi:hypothetical protein
LLLLLPYPCRFRFNRRHPRPTLLLLPLQAALTPTAALSALQSPESGDEIARHLRPDSPL